LEAAEEALKVTTQKLEKKHIALSNLEKTRSTVCEISSFLTAHTVVAENYC
jgi:hypothetical protein